MASLSTASVFYAAVMCGPYVFLGAAGQKSRNDLGAHRVTRCGPHKGRLTSRRPATQTAGDYTPSLACLASIDSDPTATTSTVWNSRSKGILASLFKQSNFEKAIVFSRTVISIGLCHLSLQKLRVVIFFCC